MNKQLQTNIILVLEDLRAKFNHIASESDESAAYHAIYKVILSFGDVCRLCNIYDALKEKPDLLKWFKTAYTRCDKIMMREYLNSKNGDE